MYVHIMHTYSIVDNIDLFVVVDDVKYNDVRDYIIRKSLKIQKDSN